MSQYLDRKEVIELYEKYQPCMATRVYDFGEALRKLPVAEERPHGECKTCKHYIPYREQFSDRNRGDGYCKSTITNSEGQAYINCHDEWYCANYEKGEVEE